MRCAVVNLTSYIVENLIIANPSVDPTPDGFLLISVSDEDPVSIGWSYSPEINDFIPEATPE